MAHCVETNNSPHRQEEVATYIIHDSGVAVVVGARERYTYFDQVSLRMVKYVSLGGKGRCTFGKFDGSFSSDLDLDTVRVELRASSWVRRV